MTVRRVMGMETEYGIADAHNPRANILALCAQIVETYGTSGSASRAGDPVRWDYAGESPLNDARGYKISRSAAHPSLLTDDPDRPAPSGESSPDLHDFAVGSCGVDDFIASDDAINSYSRVRRPSEAELALPKAPNAVLTNGARFYVDHAHPEYSAPEVISPKEAVMWDRAGDVIAREAMDLARSHGLDIVLYKNNLDGKGSAYGTHENYLMARSVDFRTVIKVLTPFLVTRPIICGAGRVGLGKFSEHEGFQISQRADYIENDIGIETTFNRPIINTRDEAHADEHIYRRLHVINGDANQFDVSNFLKLGSTSLVLWLLEHAPTSLEKLSSQVQIAEPVSANQIVSRDLSMRATLDMSDGSQKTAIDIQRLYLDTLRRALEQAGEIDGDTAQVLQLWEEVLDALSGDIYSAAPRVEWVAKLQMLESLRARGAMSWGDDRLKAFDFQWHDLRLERSIVNRLDQVGRIERLISPRDALWASTHAPGSTRAFLRGGLIARFPEAVASAGWEAVTLDIPGCSDLVRLPMLYPERATCELVGKLLEEAGSISDFLQRLSAVPVWA